jgi:hypothetical protein
MAADGIGSEPLDDTWNNVMYVSPEAPQTHMVPQLSISKSRIEQLACLAGSSAVGVVSLANGLCEFVPTWQ